MKIRRMCAHSVRTAVFAHGPFGLDEIR